MAGEYYLSGTVNKYNFNPIIGEGVYLFDKENRKVIDLACANGTNILGYKNNAIEQAIVKQLQRGFLNQSNYYYNNETKKLSLKLCKLAGFIENVNYNYIPTGKIFFCSSRDEANEYAIKIARKRYNTLCERDYCEIICMDNAFHGETIANISMTNRKKLTLGLEPLLSGFKIAKLNDINSVERLITEHTAGIFLETIQTEYNIEPCKIEFLQNLRKLCDKHEIALILDETQCGCGRTGTFFAYEKYGIKPDIITLSGGIAGGLPFGVCLAKKEFADFMNNIETKSFFSEHSLCCCVANSVIDIITQEGFMDKIIKNSEIFKNKLIELQKQYPYIIEKINVIGMIIGIKIHNEFDIKNIANVLLSNGLSTISTDENVLKLLPQLIINENNIIEAINIMKQSFEEISVIENY